MLLLTENESCFSKCGACAYKSDIGVHRGECVNGSSLGFYQNAWVFLLAETKLSHSSLCFVLHIIHFSTVFSLTRINLLIILKDVDEIFLLEWLIYLKHVFDYSVICCRYDVPGNYIVISVTAENTVLNLIGNQNGLNFKYVNECTTYPH